MAGPVKKNHFIWITIAMIGMMISSAFSRDMPQNLALDLFQYSSVALLLLSLLSLGANRLWAKGFVVVVGLMLTVVVIRGVTQVEYFEYFYLGLYLVFLIGAALLVGSQVLLTGSVDANIIVGSLALYLLIGFIWSIFYTLLLLVSPGALNGIEAIPWYDNLSTTTYFSFVTLTTLGFGDISPASPVARVIVVLEAITGMFYLAVIVASLVGGRRNKT